jgi:hypothetical protein
MSTSMPVIIHFQRRADSNLNGGVVLRVAIT